MQSEITKESEQYRWESSVGPFNFTFGYAASWGSIMSTAIVSAYTPEGFIIGADGMRRDQLTGKVKNLRARKIFSIEHEDFVLAYGWVGVTRILDPKGQPAFSFRKESEEFGKELLPQKDDSFLDYAQDFFGEVYSKLVEAKQSGKISAYPTGRKTQWGEEQITSALLIGYFRGTPCRAQVEFSHVQQRLLPPRMREIHDGDVPIDFKIHSGSFDTYKEIKPTHLMPGSLSDAEKLVRDYIQACINNQSRFEDCKDIGGHIHIAKITPQAFDWIIPPL